MKIYFIFFGGLSVSYVESWPLIMFKVIGIKFGFGGIMMLGGHGIY
jgi:hypothetical protein